MFLSYVLPHDVNAGYHDFKGVLIESINGVKIRSLKDVPGAFAAPVGGYHIIKTDPHTDWDGQLILNAVKAKDAHAEILTRYRVPSTAPRTCSPSRGPREIARLGVDADRRQQGQKDEAMSLHMVRIAQAPPDRKSLPARTAGPES